MPALTNPKHERFAQERAKGKTADEAYQEAGYTENRGNAARLNANENVLRRVAEIQERAAIRAEISVAGLTDELVEILKSAKLGDTAGHLNAARQSVMDIAKLNGLVVEKSEATITDKRASEMTEEELLAVAAGGRPGAT